MRQPFVPGPGVIEVRIRQKAPHTLDGFFYTWIPLEQAVQIAHQEAVTRLAQDMATIPASVRDLPGAQPREVHPREPHG